MSLIYTKTHLSGYLIGSYYLSDKDSDITIVVDGHRLHGHKFVLSSKSIVFKKMFFGDFKEAKESTIVIKDCDVVAFKLMLKYIYWEELSSDDWQPNDLSLAMEVFKVSHIYQIKPLSAICELKMIGMTGVDNIIDILRFGLLYRRKRVLVFVRKFVQKFSNELLAAKELLKLKTFTEIKFMLKSLKCNKRSLVINLVNDLVDSNHDNWRVDNLLSYVQINDNSVDDLS